MNRQIFLSSKKNTKRSYTLEQLELLPFYTYDDIKFEQAIMFLSSLNGFTESNILKRMLDNVQTGLETKKQFQEFLQLKQGNNQSQEQENQPYLYVWPNQNDNQQPIELIYSSEPWLNNIIHWLQTVAQTAMQDASEQDDYLLRQNVFQCLTILNQVLHQHHQFINEQYIPELALTFITDARFRSVCFQIINNMSQRYAIDIFSNDTIIMLIKAATDDVSNISLLIDGTTLYVTILSQLYNKIQHSQLQSTDIIQLFNQRLQNSEYLMQVYQNMINIICANVPEQYVIHNIAVGLSYMISINKDMPVAKVVQEMLKKLDFNSNECDYRASVFHFFSQVALTQQVPLIDNQILIDQLLDRVIEYINLKHINLKEQQQYKKISFNEIKEICILLTNMSYNPQCLETMWGSQYMTLSLMKQSIQSTVHIIANSFIKIAGQIITSYVVLPFNEAEFYQLMIDKTYTLLYQYNECCSSNKQFTQRNILENIFGFWDDFISQHGRETMQYEQLYEIIQMYSALDIVQEFFTHNNW